MTRTVVPGVDPPELCAGSASALSVEVHTERLDQHVPDKAPPRTFGTLLAATRSKAEAVSAFTCYDVETAVGVLSAAEEISRPVILLVSHAAAASTHGRFLMPALVAAAAQCSQPAFVQLDHCDNLLLIEKALDLGIHAVMADGSKLPDSENAEFTSTSVALCARYAVAVEGELGAIGGDEDRDSGGVVSGMTDVSTARQFAEDTGVDCLAVAVGNVHGSYKCEPQLDLVRLQELVAATPVPITLHGTSGLRDAQVRQTVEIGVVKLNVNTELRSRRFTDLGDLSPSAAIDCDVLGLNAALAAGARAVAYRKLALCAAVTAQGEPKIGGVR